MTRALLETVDALARLRLYARRAGVELSVHTSSPELLELVELCGLGDALRVEPRGQPEEREERRRIEEEAELPDPAV